ncbi:MAG: signal peptidase I [Clostridium sp.]|jgi:signal peptidase I|nr:signal peptidase I [Clostridium sp.]
MKKIDRKKVVKEIISTGLYLLGVLLFTYFFVTFIGQRTEVNGDSMETTLANGDQLVVDKISYRFREPQRFDIIVFPFRYLPDTHYIKRIIGLPGEIVQIDEAGTIYIDGEVLEESYGREIISAQKRGLAVLPVILGEDEYFVLGDNRNNSADSRDALVGNIRRGDIVGRAWLRIWPFGGFGFLRHQ